MKGFLLGIVLAVLLAQHMPWLGLTGGPVRPEITIKLLGVATIFFCSGLKIRLRDAMDAAKNWRAHANQRNTLSRQPWLSSQTLRRAHVEWHSDRIRSDRAWHIMVASLLSRCWELEAEYYSLWELMRLWGTVLMLGLLLMWSGVRALDEEGADDDDREGDLT